MMMINSLENDRGWTQLAAAINARHDKSRGESVFEILKAAISDGLLQPGERLREDELATRLNVSRTPVREALNRLVERKLVEPAGGRGLVIRRLSYSEAFELYAMREIIEGAATQLAALNATPAEVELLNTLNASFAEKGLCAHEYAKRNKRFHDAIADAARNRYLYDPMQFIQESLILLGSTTFTVADRQNNAVEEHQRMIDAISNKDPELAEEAARQHIRAAFAVRLQILNNAP
ncbi:GntR family transcriptional regulator [uncultured Bartonella sp.]|uniref:GntR family transcriptional regulator n=1 Tax=uncultured Bartonella sp. TaxID=104108 RepID=UPI00262EF63D|nr:GntR family transcriptional regulator [uncultured Bartonella sp.]